MYILFDLGGVLFDIDYMRTQRAFEALGYNGFDAAYSKKVQNEVFDAFEVGALDEDSFFNKIREYGRISAMDVEIRSAWNAMLIGLRTSKVAYVQQLAQTHKLFLLSNTNPIHLAALRTEYPLFADLEKCFTQTFYSHLIQRRKPHAEVFRWVCAEMGAAPGEVIFVDDSPQHVAGAKEAGLNACHLAYGVEVEALLSELLKA